MIGTMRQAQDVADALLASCGPRPLSAKHQKILDGMEVNRVRYEAWKAEQFAAHEVVMRDATGLRAHVLTIHGPVVSCGYLVCEGCGNEPGPIAESKRFPCDTYVLARDWRDES
jgi:hypothetical protein